MARKVCWRTSPLLQIWLQQWLSSCGTGILRPSSESRLVARERTYDLDLCVQGQQSLMDLVASGSSPG